MSTHQTPISGTLRLEITQEQTQHLFDALGLRADHLRQRDALGDRAVADKYDATARHLIDAVTAQGGAVSYGSVVLAPVHAGEAREH